MKAYNGREFIKILNNNGFRHIRTTGSHSIYKKGSQTMAVNKNIKQVVIRRLIKEYELEV